MKSKRIVVKKYYHQFLDDRKDELCTGDYCLICAEDQRIDDMHWQNLMESQKIANLKLERVVY